MNVTRGNAFADKMTANFDVLGTLMKNRIVCDVESCLVITRRADGTATPRNFKRFLIQIPSLVALAMA